MACNIIGQVMIPQKCFSFTLYDSLHDSSSQELDMAYKSYNIPFAAILVLRGVIKFLFWGISLSSIFF